MTECGRKRDRSGQIRGQPAANQSLNSMLVSVGDRAQWNAKVDPIDIGALDALTIDPVTDDVTLASAANLILDGFTGVLAKIGGMTVVDVKQNGEVEMSSHVRVAASLGVGTSGDETLHVGDKLTNVAGKLTLATGDLEMTTSNAGVYGRLVASGPIVQVPYHGVGIVWNVYALVAPSAVGVINVRPMMSDQAPETRVISALNIGGGDAPVAVDGQVVELALYPTTADQFTNDATLTVEPGFDLATGLPLTDRVDTNQYPIMTLTGSAVSIVGFGVLRFRLITAAFLGVGAWFQL